MDCTTVFIWLKKVTTANFNISSWYSLFIFLNVYCTLLFFVEDIPQIGISVRKKFLFLSLEMNNNFIVYCC